MVNLLSPAKVNLRLDVLSRRADSYHNILSLMQLVDLSDEVEVSLGGRGPTEIEVFCHSTKWASLVPQGEGNLAYRAAQGFTSASGLRQGVRISIRKMIPVGAGLGGGSSNAAAVLLALQSLSRKKMSKKSLILLARRIGADVPFFLFGHPAWASGIGDILTRVKIPFPLWFVLVYPGFSISTRWAYEQLDARRASRGPALSKAKGLTKKIRNIRITKEKEFKDLEELVGILHNDLEEVSLGAYPEIVKAKQDLLTEGARGDLMTGSGSTVFGLFLDESSARIASQKITGKGWEVYCVRGITGWGVDKR